MFLTDDEAPQAGPKAKRQRVAPVQRKPAAKPEASDEASEFKTDDEPEGNKRRSSEVQRKPVAKPMSGAADKAEEAKLRAACSRRSAKMAGPMRFLPPAKKVHLWWEYRQVQAQQGLAAASWTTFWRALRQMKNKVAPHPQDGLPR